MIKVTINRKGEFKVGKNQRHVNQCGQMGVKHYTYAVSVTGNSRHLDSQGFLIDNMVIRQYFIDTYEVKKKKCLSCENMACAAVDWIVKFCKNNKTKGIQRIVVEISGSDKSFIQAEWTKK